MTELKKFMCDNCKYELDEAEFTLIHNSETTHFCDFACLSNFLGNKFIPDFGERR